MPRVALWLIDLTVTAIPADDSGAPMEADILLNSGYANQAIDIDLTVTSILASAYAAPTVVAGVTIQLERGGVLETLDATDVASTISITRRLDGFAPEASIAVIDPDSRPLRDLWMQTKGQLIVTAHYGIPGLMTSRELFSGYVARVDQTDREISISAYGKASRISEAMVTIAVPPGSRRTRGSIVREVVAGLVDGDGNPLGVVSVELGPDDGGRIVKGVSEGGTRRFFDWVKEFLSPIGATGAESGGKIVIKRWTTASVARVIPASEIRGAIRVSPASTQEPNMISVAGSIFDPDFLGDDGTAAYQVEEQVTRVPYDGAYSVIAAPEHQASTGAITATGLTDDELQEGAMITRALIERFNFPERTDMLGVTLYPETRNVTTQWGWYAPRCAPRHASAGVLTYNAAYRYEDQTFSRWSKRRFIETRKTIETETKIPAGTDVFGNPRPGKLVRETLVYGWAPLENAIARRGIAGARDPVDSYLTFEGVGWQNFEESYTLVSREVEETIADDQGLVALVITKLYELAFAPEDINEEDTYIYGPYSSERGGKAEQANLRVVSTTERTLVPLGEGRYREQIARTTIQQGQLPIDERTLDGSRPALNLSADAAPIGKSQVNRQTFRDLGAVARFGAEVREGLQNEYCETADEVLFVARETRGRYASSNVDGTINFDISTDVGDTVQFARDPVEGNDVLVTDMNISFDLASGNNTIALGTLYTPAEYR